MGDDFKVSIKSHSTYANIKVHEVQGEALSPEVTDTWDKP
jgi:hypothetical protein